MDQFYFRKEEIGKIKLYSHKTLPGLFELVPIEVPNIYSELTECMYFIEYIELLKSEGCFYMVIPYQGCDLSIIIAENEHLEETYVSLIMRTVIEALMYLHSHSFFSLNLRLDNWRILPCGSLKAKDRFTLSRLFCNKKNDIDGFIKFTSQLCNINNFQDLEICVSSLFKEFLNYVANLTTDNFKALRDNKFIKKCTNSLILADLVENHASLSSMSHPGTYNKPEALLERSSSSQGQNELVEEEFVFAVNKIFEKFIASERTKHNEKVAAILDIIKRHIISLYKCDAPKAYQLIKFYFK